MLTREELLQQALEGLLDGLDANGDERCGLSQEQWDSRLRDARKVLEKACPTARDAQAKVGRIYAELESMVRDIASRIGPGRVPESIRAELEALANRLHSWAHAGN